MNILQTIKEWGFRSFILAIVNKVLGAYSGNIDRARAIVIFYVAKFETITGYLKSLDAKLADGKITDEEAASLYDEAKALVKTVTTSAK